MDSLYKLGAKALASRLKRVSDSLMAEVSHIYDALELPFDAPCYPLFALLLQNDTPLNITDAAQELGITHAAASQKAAQLKKRGYVTLQSLKEDKRVKVIQLTNSGEAVASKLAPFWQAIDAALYPLMTETQPMLSQIAKLEAYIQTGDFKRDIMHRYRPIEIFNFRPEWSHYFESLNTAWIAEHFIVEPYDAKVLADPASYILRDGGQVFFGQYKGEIVATCALMKTGEDAYEFTKMAVSSHLRGKGLGKMLIKHALDYAYRHLRAQEVWLLTSGKLDAANHLYASLGFSAEELTPEDKAKYARADRKYRYIFETIKRSA